jgi:hypothetical protein
MSLFIGISFFYRFITSHTNLEKFSPLFLTPLLSFLFPISSCVEMKSILLKTPSMSQVEPFLPVFIPLLSFCFLEDEMFRPFNFLNCFLFCFFR